MYIENLRFDDESEYEYESNLILLRVFSKKEIPESFISLFFHQKTLVRFLILKEVKPSPDRKMIKLLAVDNLFPPLRHSR